MMKLRSQITVANRHMNFNKSQNNVGKMKENDYH
uniref:Uncharacterized protein n=1 Tax=Tetranychus urticae TaxID=32264 RepID=T1L4G5_TETUR